MINPEDIAQADGFDVFVDPDEAILRTERAQAKSPPRKMVGKWWENHVRC